jgi:4-oxalmesaconate hydratase
VLYNEESLRLLIKIVGADRCLFGAECPGVGSAVDPETGNTLDHIAPHILGFDWLSDEEKRMIFSGNAIKVFNLEGFD